MKRQTTASNNGFGKRVLSAALSIVMAASLMPAMPAAQVSAEETELLKAGPVNASESTVTKNQPFASGTAGSTYFRIPAMITTQEGYLVAAADARWGTTGDGGGLDTIASVSTDGGATWNYSFPLYFPDSNKYAGTSATTIIDPMLVEDADGVIYCMADVNPSGVTTMSGYTQPGKGTGYITAGGEYHLALTSNYSNVNTKPADSDTTTYEYYVGDWNDEGYAPVMKRSDNTASDYAVDKWYNIYTVSGGEYLSNLTQTQVNSSTVIQQNCFYKDSILHVYNTGYMMYATSTDGGFTWGDPEILNPYIKRDDNSESALLVSPGQGICLSDGTLVIPFYNHGDGEENASIAWRDPDTGEWTRSNDVPGASDGGWWSSESEAVELSDGTIRLFFRSGQYVVSYADATKNDEGDYEFGQPVTTGASVHSECNVTAIKYSKKIDGQDAILVAMPGGSNRTNGKIFLFLVNDDANHTMTLKSTYSVPNSSSAYAYSCMTELPDGTIGLLWENAGGSIRYDNIEITDIATDSYIEGAEIDVELWANETYTRSYTYSSDYMTGITQTPEEGIATATVTRDPEEAATGTTVSLYAHTSNTASSLDSFATSADSSLSLSDAEMTITSVSGVDNGYTIYNSHLGMYYVNTTAANMFSSSSATVLVTATDGADTFRISNSSAARYLYLYLTNMDFNSDSGTYAASDTKNYELTLWKASDTASSSSLIPGYEKATSVVSGESYLITCIYDSTNVILFYPSTSSTAAHTKLIGVEYDVEMAQESTVTITAGQTKGTTTAVIDGVTYNITSKGNPELSLSVGETYFIEGASSDNLSTSDGSVASATAGTQEKMALFDCESQASYSLSGYAAEPNWDNDITAAEFIITDADDGAGYTIYSPTEETYLVNSNASTFFGSAATAHYLLAVTNSDGTVSFQIKRVSDGRYVFFAYSKMAFDAYSTASGTGGDYGFVLLEKQDEVSDTDPIPGYARVSQITSGKSYLITYFYESGTESGIIVLYPRSGITNQSKLYQSVEVSGVYIAALQSGSAQVTVDGITYDVTVGDCSHKNTEIRNQVEAGCETPGYTGDTYCVNCGDKLSEGEVIPATGHQWDEGTVTTVPTAEADGVKTYTCLNDPSHTYTETFTFADYIKELLESAIAEAEEKLVQSTEYTEAARAELETALEEANQLIASGTATEIQLEEAYNKINDAINRLVQQDAETPDTSTTPDTTETSDTSTTPDATKTTGTASDTANTSGTTTATPGTTAATAETIVAGASYAVGNYSYKVISTSAKTVEVTGFAKESLTKIVIYNSVKLNGETYKVTAVAANAFKGETKPTSLTVKKGVTSIGANAFAGCTNLKKAVIKSTTLKSIGKKAFYNCRKLTSITIKSKALKKVGKQAFKGINAKCVIKVPKAKKAAYTKLLKGKGQKATVKIK